MATLEAVVVAQVSDRFFDLVDLDRRVDQQGQVGDANTNDLNGILEAEGVPNEQQLVKETEDEERQEGRNGLVLGSGVGVCRIHLRGQMSLELGEDITEIVGSTG